MVSKRLNISGWDRFRWWWWRRGRQGGSSRLQGWGDTCESVIREAWEEHGAGGGSVMGKIKNVARSLHSWSGNVLGDLEKRVKKLRKEIEQCRRLPISDITVQREAVLS